MGNERQTGTPFGLGQHVPGQRGIQPPLRTGRDLAPVSGARDTEAVDAEFVEAGELAVTSPVHVPDEPTNIIDVQPLTGRHRLNTAMDRFAQGTLQGVLDAARKILGDD